MFPRAIRYNRERGKIQDSPCRQRDKKPNECNILAVTHLESIFCSHTLPANPTKQITFVQNTPEGGGGRGTPSTKIRIQPKMTKLKKAVLLVPLLLATIILPAQNHRNDAYNNGMRNGGRGGNYYNNNDRQYNYHDDHRQGGIGPGKGALIGAGGGAVLGAVFGGGLKGTIIGGAAGAGIGAVVGQAAQNKRDNNDRYRRPY